MKLRLGDLVRLNNSAGEVYVYAQVKAEYTNLISIYSGNRWSDENMGDDLSLEALNTDEYNKWDYVGRFE